MYTKVYTPLYSSPLTWNLDAIALAADPDTQAEFHSSPSHRNIIGAYNAFEATRHAGCSRIVFAGSVNAVLGHHGRRMVYQDLPVYSTNVCGATKCWGAGMSPRDCAQLFCCCVDPEDVDFALVSGISRHCRRRLDLHNTH